MLELLPCPFCGGEAEITVGEQGGQPTEYVECLGCEALGESGAAWNRRVRPPLRESTVKTLRRIALIPTSGPACSVGVTPDEARAILGTLVPVTEGREG